MKKRLISFVIVVLVSVMFVGCGKEQSAENNSLISTMSYTGTVEGLPTAIEGLDATHVMITTEKQRVYLRSLLYDLSQYEGSEIRVNGNIFVEEVGSGSVDLLVVNSIDLLDGLNLSNEDAELKMYKTSKLGLELEYDTNVFALDEIGTRLLLTSIDKPGSIVFKLFKNSPEIDVQLLTQQTYKDEQFEKVIVGTKQFQSNKNTAKNKIVYIFEKDSFFYEIVLVGFSKNDLETRVEVIESILSNTKFVTINNDYFNQEVVSDGSELEVAKDVEGSTQVASAVNSKFSSAIDKFRANVSTLLPDFSSSLSYSFVDENNFYFVYLDKSEEQKRVQVRASSGNYEITASFDRGEGVDWVLKSGVNNLFNKPQTLVLVGSEGVPREVEVKKGYRYFESLPLGFGMQYPQSWYYSRTDDTYLFSDKPFSEGSAIINAEFVKRSFAQFSGSKLSETIKKATAGQKVYYYIDLDGNTLVIDTSVSFDSIAKDMAESIVEIAN